MNWSKNGNKCLKFHSKISRKASVQLLISEFEFRVRIQKLRWWPLRRQFESNFCFNFARCQVAAFWCQDALSFSEMIFFWYEFRYEFGYESRSCNHLLVANLPNVRTKPRTRFLMRFRWFRWYNSKFKFWISLKSALTENECANKQSGLYVYRTSPVNEGFSSTGRLNQQSHREDQRKTN